MWLWLLTKAIMKNTGGLAKGHGWGYWFGSDCNNTNQTNNLYPAFMAG
jgi:hypothetical protein